MDKQNAGNQGNEAQKKIEVRKWIGHQDCGFVTMAALTVPRSGACADSSLHVGVFTASRSTPLCTALGPIMDSFLSCFLHDPMRNRTTGGAA